MRSFQVLFVLVAVLASAAGSGYVTLYFWSTLATCTGTNSLAQIYQTDTCYAISTSVSLRFGASTTGGTTTITQTYYASSADCSTGAENSTVANGGCVDSDGTTLQYTTSYPSFSTLGFMQLQYSETNCQGPVTGVWLQSGVCVNPEGTTFSEKVVCDNGQATLYISSASTTCGTPTTTYPNQVFSHCTAASSSISSAVSETSYCTGTSSSSSSDVGSLTAQEVIWAMIGVLVGAALFGALLTTFICPNCIKTGFGSEASAAGAAK